MLSLKYLDFFFTKYEVMTKNTINSLRSKADLMGKMTLKSP